MTDNKEKSSSSLGEKDKDKLFHLKLQVNKGKGILGSDSAVCSPYVKVSWGNKKKAIKTKVFTKSADPEWNHPAQFEIKRAKYPEKKPELEIEVYEHNKFSGDKVIGVTNYLVVDNNLVLGEPTNVSLSVVLNASTKHEAKGEVSLTLTPLDFGQDKAVVEKQKAIEEQKRMVEVEKQFAILCEQLANDAKSKEAMLRLPYKTKLLMIEQHKDKLSNEKTPDHFAVKLLRELVMRDKKSASSSPVGGASSPGVPAPSADGLTVSDLKDISVALRSRGLDWIRQFHKLEATSRLVELLNVINRQPVSTEDSIQQQLECLSCIKNLMNNKIGISFILSIKDSFKIIGSCLGSPNEKINELAIGLLNAICFSSNNGHRIIIEVMNNNKVTKGESRRFVSLVEALKSRAGVKETRESLKMKSIYLSFINIIVNSPPEIDLRLSLRSEFFMLGLKELLADLSKYEYDESPELDTQITVFEDEESKDNKEMSERFSEFPGLNLANIDDIIRTMMERIRPLGLVDTFREVVKDLLLLPTSEDAGLRTWIIASRIIKQISLRDKNIGIDDDIVPLDNLLLMCEQEAKELPLKAEIAELKSASVDVSKKVTTQDIELKEKMEIIKKYEETSAKQLEELAAKLKSKEDEVKDLADQIAKLKLNGVVGTAAPPAPISDAPPPPPPPG
eukprot:gene12056-14107_t